MTEHQTPDPQWPCARCGRPKAEHVLVNWSDAPHVGAAALVCPTAIYEARPFSSDAGDGNQPRRSDAVDPAAPRTVNGPTRD